MRTVDEVLQTKEQNLLWVTGDIDRHLMKHGNSICYFKWQGVISQHTIDFLLNLWFGDGYLLLAWQKEFTEFSPCWNNSLSSKR